MDPIARKARSHTKWLLLSLLCGLALARPAHAGQLGPMWSCRTWQFGAIVRANAVQGKRCRVARVSPSAAVLFFTVKERNGAASRKCHVPASLAKDITQQNQNTLIVDGNHNVVTLQNDQSNIFIGHGTWFFCCPKSAVGSVLQKNINATVVAGNGNIVLVESNQENIAVDSGSAAAIAQVNINLVFVAGDNNVVWVKNTQSNMAA